MTKKVKIAMVSTVPFFLDNQLSHYLKFLLSKGFEVDAISSPEGDWSRLNQINNLNRKRIEIKREPSFLSDLLSLWRLFRYFKKEKFDVIHSTTPKAGLLCALAAKAAGNKVRVHTFTGQVWATKSGLKRQLLKLFDTLIVALNTQCYADSKSQKQFLDKEKISKFSTIKVLGSGSLAGVNLNRFDHHKWEPKRQNIRNELGLLPKDFVLLFIGRLSKEKGVLELVDAFNALSKKHSFLKLLLVGPCEEQVIQEKLDKQWTQSEKIHYMGVTKCPEYFFSAADLLCLPSYREGFGTVVIEAAAMKLATLGTDIIGLQDAIKNKEFGYLVPVKNSRAIEKQIEQIIQNPTDLMKVGENAYQRCINQFDSDKLNQLMIQEYYSLLEKD